MKYLILPVLLTILCLTGFTSQVQANDGSVMSLEHGGTTDVMGSREFDVIVCNEFEVELWVRDLPVSMNGLLIYVIWDRTLMELQNVELNLPSGWYISDGPNEKADSFYIKLEGTSFTLNWKWMTFTFHCEGEGSRAIVMPELYYPNGGALDVGPLTDEFPVARTLLKAAVTQRLPSPVGGLVTPLNKLEILTPYMALAGLIIAVSAVYVVKRRKD